MGLKDFLSFSADTIKNFGVLKYLFDLFYRVGHRTFGLMILEVVILDQTGLNAQSLENPGRYDLKFVTSEPLYQLADKNSDAISKEFIDQVSLTGDRCFAVLEGEEIVSFGWYSKRPTEINSKLRFNFDPSYVYMYKGYTSHAYRGQKLHALGMAHALLAYIKEGARGLVSYVEANNYRSLSSCERLGYARIGRIFYAQIFGRSISLKSSGCKVAGVYLSDAPTPQSHQEIFQLVNSERLT